MMGLFDYLRQSGTYAVLTRSGAFYVIVCSKNIAGAVTLEGGSLNVHLHDAVVNEYDDCKIRVGESMDVTEYGHRKFASSPVQEIYDIGGDDLGLEDYLRARAIQIKRGLDAEEAKLYPPVLMKRF